MPTPSPLKIKDVQTLLGGTPNLVIEFTAGIVDSEAYAEPGMRARVTSYRDDGDDVCIIGLDFAPFDSHNIPLEQANYFDSAGNAVLTARQAGQYEPQDDMFFTPDDEMDTRFTVLANEGLALFEEYRASASPLSYWAWLEAELLAARAAGATL